MALFEYAFSLANDLVVALLGGVLAGLASLVWRFARNKSFERKLLIGGEFISFFEDTQDGQRVRLYAKAVLRQRGRKLLGHSDAYDNQLGRERNWRLEGELAEHGAVVGTYVCTTLHQEGSGAFALQVVKSDLVGFWTGYDSDNHVMNHGAYVFRRLLSVEIRRYVAADRSAVVRIAEATLGRGWFAEPDQVEQDERANIWVAVSLDRIVGFCVGKQLSGAEFAALFPAVPTGVLPLAVRDALRLDCLGMIPEIAVAPEAQERGVGHQLAKATINALRAAGSSAIVIPAWRVEGRLAAQGLLDAFDCRKFTEAKGYWKAECLAGQFQCKAKRGRSCRCDLVLFHG